MTKVSIITVVFNAAGLIEQCISSVFDQSYGNIEYIIVDGGSTDGTVEVIKKYEQRISKWISAPDKGLYYALNKGLQMASGEITGFLHADDVYANNRIVETVVSEMTEYNVDGYYGDLLYVDRYNVEKIVRYWKSSPYYDGLFKKGWMLPHPTLFLKRDIYNRYGFFNTDFRIAADYELMLRFFEKHKVSLHYIPEVFIKMRVGGVSNRSLKNIFRKTSEDYKAWKVNNLSGGWYTILLKNITKIPQFFVRE